MLDVDLSEFRYRESYNHWWSTDLIGNVYKSFQYDVWTIGRFKGKVAVITVKRKQYKWGWKVRYRPCPSGGEQTALISHRWESILVSDAWVLAKLRTNIWEETYVDFGSLLTNPAREGQYQLSIDNSGEGSSPSLAIEPVNPLKKIVSTDLWVQVFHVFVGVYTSHYDSETQALWNMGPPFKILLPGVTTGVTMTNIL